jgi:hypothetical protein
MILPALLEAALWIADRVPRPVADRLARAIRGKAPERDPDARIRALDRVEAKANERDKP